MKVNVKKLNGNSEPLDIGKILKWGEWACADSPNVSFESILAATEASFYDGVETAEINLAICTQCEIMAMVSAQEEDYQLVEEYTHIARNLYIPTLLKKSNYFQSKYLTSDDILEGGEFKLTDTNIVPLPRYKLKSIIRLGVELDTYDPALLDGSISDELFEYADSLLDYSYMNNLKFGGMRQFEGKYLRRIDGHLLEDPLQLQLLVALAAVRSDITFHPNCKTIEGQKEALENYYRLNRNVEQNLPTPFLLCFRTNSKTYDSCCLVNMGDTNPSIRATQTVIGEATEAGAGLGVNMGRIRSKGTRFKKMGKHQGLLGYLGLSSKNLKANNQESRGGSGTINVPIWTRDFYDLVMLKDVTGVEGENRYRHLDYCFSFSMYLVEKIRKNEKILLASPHTLLPSGKTIYEAFFTNFPEGGYDDSEFIAFCEEKLKDPNIPYVNNENSGTGKAGSFAYTYALDMFLTLCRQMINTGRIYTFNATHVNNHSSFLSPIEMTNLCVEILQPTSPPSYQYSSKEHTIIPNDGEVSFCQLGGLVMSPTVTKEELPRIAYWMLRFQEAVFNTSEYSKISFSQKQKDRRNIGIGLVNYQYLLVREVYSKYPESEWVSRVAEVTHDWYEAIQFNLIKANIKLAQELGPCGLASDSKYSKGILPIDHYYKTKLTDFPLKQDWESLRPLAIKYGVRFSTITALMPVESSSVIYNLISGIDFPRKPAVYKGNKVLSVLVTVPEIAKYGKHYVYAWNKYKSFDINELYLAMCANITKFLDQSISYNNYIKYSNFEGNKVPEEYMLETFILGPAYNGIKTTYYINFDSDLTVKDENEDDKKLQKELTEEEKEFQEQLRILELKQVEEGGIACSSGSCAL